jgi:hypothetical protein
MRVVTISTGMLHALLERGASLPACFIWYLKHVPHVQCAAPAGAAHCTCLAAARLGTSTKMRVIQIQMRSSTRTSSSPSSDILGTESF